MSASRYGCWGYHRHGVHMRRIRGRTESGGRCMRARRRKSVKPGLTLVLCGLALVFAATQTPTIHANTLVVTSSADGAATPANCPGAACRLRDALAAANANDTITFNFTG